MTDERSTFEVTRARLEDIVGQVRRKDVSLEQSLDLLEEAVRLVNQCNELIDQTAFRAETTDADGAPQPDAANGSTDGGASDAAAGAPEAGTGDEPAGEDEDAALDVIGSVETYELVGADGEEVAVIESVEILELDGAAPIADELGDDERS